MSRRKPVPVPLNKIQGRGLFKYDLSQMPPKRKKTADSVKTSSKKTSTTTVICNDSLVMEEDMSTDLHKGFVRNEYVKTASCSIPVQNPFRIYCMAINESDFFCPCNEDFTAFAMADFNCETKELLKQKIQVVRRKIVSFQGDNKWLYSCTCNLKNMEYVDTLSSRLELPFEDFREVINCDHIRLTQHILKDIDTFWEVVPEFQDTEHGYGIKCEKLKLELDLVELDFGSCYVAVSNTEMSPGVVSVWSSAIYCFTCQQKYCKHCKHVQMYLNRSEDEEVPDAVYKLLELLNDSHEKKRTYVYETLSRNPIEFCLPETLRQPFLDVNFVTEDGILQIFPDETTMPVCNKCHSPWEDVCFGQQKNDIPLFCSYQIHKATVFGKKCTSCDNQLVFDGGESCILNMHSFLVHHSVLRDYMFHFLHASYKDRVIINDKKTRILVNKFSKGDSLLNTEFRQMLSGIKEKFPPAQSLFEMFENIGCTTVCPVEHRPIVALIASSSPACALIPVTSDETTIARLLSTTDDIVNHPKLLAHLQQKIPLLYEIVKDSGPIPSNYKTIIEGIYEKSKSTFLSFKVSENEVIDSDEDITCFFPALKKVRNRGFFKADMTKQARDTCKKDATRHPTLLPGIFTAFCKHGVCYGFKVMESSESPNIPFTFLRTKFRKAPTTVIYDNACNLHSYCLNRDPSFFKDTLFVVDNMHWKNHTSCSKVYEAKRHPALFSINTQMVEQNNAKLRKLKSNLSYMNHNNFMNHLKFFLWHCNDKLQNRSNRLQQRDLNQQNET